MSKFFADLLEMFKELLNFFLEIFVVLWQTFGVDAPKKLLMAQEEERIRLIEIEIDQATRRKEAAADIAKALKDLGA